MATLPLYAGFLLTQACLGYMRKFSLELPKFRLELHAKLVKRRKPLLPREPIIPTTKVINKKYHSGTKIGRIARYLSDHKLARKIFAGNIATMFLATIFLPTAGTDVFGNEAQPPEIIQIQNTLKTEKSIQYPLENFKINQGYNRFHAAADLGAPVGSIVKPVKTGIVEYAGYRTDGYGNLVVISHDNNLDSYYAHLSKIYVTEGQAVNTNTVIGEVGLTGHTTGPHLHLEIHQQGAKLNPLSVLSR